MKVVIITGATDGIGKALISCLYDKYHIIAFGRNKSKMEILLKEYPLIDSYLFDMTDFNKLDEVMSKIINKYNNIDILINNAGANSKKSLIVDMDIEDLVYMLNLNCISQIKMIKSVLPLMLKQQKGHIVNILSSCCLYDNVNLGAYTASKKAMQAISKILTKEVKDQGIKVTSFYPGGVNTNFRVNKCEDYLKPITVAKTIANCLEIDDGNIQEIIIRPDVENNF